MERLVCTVLVLSFYFIPTTRFKERDGKQKLGENQSLSGMYKSRKQRRFINIQNTYRKGSTHRIQKRVHNN